MDRRDRMAATGGNKAPVCLDDHGCEIDLPWIFDVCGTCNGHGSHVNPSIDAHGISADEFAEDPDFEAQYFSGAYDQTCNECHGLRVIKVVDRDSCNVDQLAAYDAEMKADAEFAAECAAERRMGC